MPKREGRGDEEVGWISKARKLNGGPDPVSKKASASQSRSERRIHALMEDESFEGIINLKHYRAKYLNTRSMGWSRVICIMHEQALNVVFALGQRLVDPQQGFPISTVSLAANLVKRSFASDMISDRLKQCPSLPYACYNLAMKMLETELMQYDDFERLDSEVTPKMVIEMEEHVGNAVGWAIKRVTACELLEELLLTASRCVSKQWRADLVWFTVWVSAYIDVDALPSTIVKAALACVARRRNLSDLSWVTPALRPSANLLGGRSFSAADDAVLECIREMIGKAPRLAKRWSTPMEEQSSLCATPEPMPDNTSPTNVMDSLESSSCMASSSSACAAASSSSSRVPHDSFSSSCLLKPATIVEPGPLMAARIPAAHLEAVTQHNLNVTLGAGLVQHCQWTMEELAEDLAHPGHMTHAQLEAQNVLSEPGPVALPRMGA